MKEDIYFVSREEYGKPFFINIAGVSYCDGNYLINRRNSAVFCMEYIVEGRGTVRCDGSVCYPKKDDVYMLMYGHDHYYYSDGAEPWKKIWFNAGGPLIRSIVDSYGLGGRILVEKTNAFSYFDSIVSLCRSGLPADIINLKASVIFHELIQYLYRLTCDADCKISADALTMKNYIDSHISESINIGTLAALIYKSQSQTLRILKNEFGTTPYDYLLSQRFTQAKALLQNTNMQVKEIAYRTGFSDEHYFSYVFKKKFGQTPKTYRGESKEQV